MGLSKCKATTKLSLSQYDFEEVREIYLEDVCSVAMMEDIPPSLVVNWDQTGTHFFYLHKQTIKSNQNASKTLGTEDTRSVLRGTCTCSDKMEYSNM